MLKVWGASYKDIANSSVVFILCAIVIVFVLFQAIVFVRRAWQRGLELGMSKEDMKKVMTSSGIFSIVPSIPILVVMVVLMRGLGNYFPWLRLSVIGSGAYENMAADVTAKAFNLSGVADPGFTASIFVSAMWVMTIGIIWGPLYTALGSKYIQKGVKLMKGKNEKTFNAIFSTMFLSMVCVFSGTYFAGIFQSFTGGLTKLIPFLVMATAAVCIILMDVLSKKLKSRALTEFSFPISLVIGMASAILYSQILK